LTSSNRPQTRWFFADLLAGLGWLDEAIEHCSRAIQTLLISRRRLAAYRGGRPHLILAALLFSPALPAFAEQQSSPLFDTPAWFNSEMPGRILIRDAGDGKLLLTVRGELEKGAKHRGVYLYDPDAQLLRQTTDKKWDAAASSAADCASRSQVLPEKIKVDGERLYAGARALPVKGTVLLSLSYSPAGDRVAALSADGPRKASLLPFLGGGQNARGRHYQQLYSVESGAPLGEAVALPITTEREAYRACWSADGAYVFYAALLNEKLAVVKNNPR
jgi:hypothetical protein